MSGDVMQVEEPSARYLLRTDAQEVPRGYKRCEIGVIPEDWETRVLSDVSDCLDNRRVPLNEAQRAQMQGDIPYCGANGVLDYVNDFVVDDDIILIAEDGGYFDEYATRPIAYRMKGKCWVNNHAHILKARSVQDQSFLFYSLVHKNILPFLASGTRAKLNKSEMRKIVVQSPPSVSEQRAIAEALSDMDGLLGALDALIAKKRAIKQATMQQLLTGKTRLPGFRGKWETKRLEQIAEVKTGPYGSALHERDYVPEGTPIITVEHLGERGVLHANLPMVSDADRVRLKAYELTAGDIVFSRVGSIDRNALIRPSEDGWLFSGRLLRVRPDNARTSSPYLSYHFHGEHFKAHVREVAVGQTMASLNTSILQAVEVAVPTLDEQSAIAAVLSDMDAEIAALEARRDKTRALKLGMMQQLLTGRIRLA
ncbi:MAG: restriction endonuclease subunit S [Steroidobacteraceae bacterium]